MSWLTHMSDEQLRQTIARLKSDVESFRARAAAVAADLERNGLAPAEDPLHQRLSAIRDHLCAQLAQAQEALSARAQPASGGFWRSLMPRRTRLASTGGCK